MSFRVRLEAISTIGGTLILAEDRRQLLRQVSGATIWSVRQMTGVRQTSAVVCRSTAVSYQQVPSQVGLVRSNYW